MQAAVVRSLIVILFLFHCFDINAQSESIWHPVYDNYTVNDGLPSMEFYYSYQDKDGYMWFASDRGVVRYNGDKFETFTTEDGLVSNTVFKIDQDDQGRIWFLSDVARLCYFKDGKIQQYEYNDIYQKCFSHIYKVYSYTAWNFDNDRVLLSTPLSGSIKIDKTGKLTRPHEAYQLIPRRQHGNIFIEDGLILNGPRKRVGTDSVPVLTCFGMQRETLPLTLSSHMKTGWIGKDHFFICGDVGLYVSSQIGDSIYSFQKSVFTTTVIDNALWLGMQGGGLDIYSINGHELTKKNHFFDDKHITNTFKSREGHYWITTLSSGLFKIESMDVMKMNSSNSLSKSYVFVTKRNDNLILGTENKEYYFINTNPEMNDYGSIPFDSEYLTINSDVHSDEIFAYEINTQSTFKLKDFEYPVNTMYVAKEDDFFNNYGKDSYYAGGYGTRKYGDSNYIFWHASGLFDTKSNSSIDVGIDKHMVDLDGTNTLWCGNSVRVQSVDLSNGTISYPKSELLKQRINSIHNSNGKLFFGTHGNGVVIKEGESVKYLSIENGYVRKYVVRIVSKNNGPVWLMGNSGVSKLMHTDGIGYQTNEYNLPDLKCEKINDAYPDADYLYLATNKGIRRIKGGQKIDKKALPKIYLGSIEVGDSFIEGTDLTLDYDQNNIVVRFDAVSFESEPVVFRYRLNKEDDWSAIEERFIRLNTLESGSYSVEIQASINGRDWTGSELINIKILPPFWKTWWFILLDILLVTALVFFAVRLRLKFVDKQHALQQKLTDLQQEALAQQMNPHFIFNALGSVQNSILKGDSIKANKYLVKFSKLLRAGLDASRSQLIPLEDDKELMESYLSVEKTRLGESFTFDLDVQLISKEYSLFISPFLLQPIIENAIKHGIGEDHSAGNVTVSYIEEKDRIRCVILDNGKGRKAALANRLPGHVSHGSEIAFERIKLFNDSKGAKGEYYVEDLYDNENAPTGTKVVFTVPIIRQ
jgi:ligand-binding sensor domain-containing protein